MRHFSRSLAQAVAEPAGEDGQEGAFARTDRHEYE